MSASQRPSPAGASSGSSTVERFEARIRNGSPSVSVLPGLTTRDRELDVRGEGMFDEIAQTVLPVEFRGTEVMFEAHAFEDDSSSYQAMALVHRGENAASEVAPLVRVHSGCVTGDVFHSLRCDCYAQLQLAIERVLTSELGIIIYLPHHEGRGIGLVKKLQAYAEQDRGLDTVDANVAVGAPIDARDYKLPAKILKYLGFERIRLMTNNPVKVSKLTEHGIEVVDQARSITTPSQHNQKYLDTKRARMDHKL
ncbi:MAG: GTP cyclohydrolase II [Pseudomonadota bacterium]